MVQPELVAVVVLLAEGLEVAKAVQPVSVAELAVRLTVLEICRLYLNCWRRADQ